ncbi:hypothetical protein Tco_0294098 [Tanacetum coccineum]
MANLKYSDKHNMVAFLKKPNESVGFTEVVDFLKGTSLRYALTHNPTIWQTATVRTLANGTQQLVASIDSKEYTITEASVRSKLQLADATGIHNLSDAEIYAGLATLGYVTEGDIVPLLPAMLAGAAVDQGEGSAQPAEPHHTPVDPIPSTSQPPHSPHPSPPHPSPPHPSPPHPSPPHPSPLHQSPPHFSPPRVEGNQADTRECCAQISKEGEISGKSFEESTYADVMADMNIPANDAPAVQAPAVAPQTRTDDQILPLSNCKLDEQWFNLHKDILKDALDITPTNDNNPFVASPSSDTVIKYVNTLGYHSILRNLSAMSVNALYQPWRAILSMINMCLTGKTAGYDRPIHPTFLTDMKNLATTARGKKKTAHLLIPSIRFTKMIIHHLRTKHNIHPRTGSPLHYSHEESILNTLRFVGKDERGKAEEGGATESSDATKVTKPKAAKVTKPAGDKAPKPTATQPPKPKPTPTQPSKAVLEKKQKLVKKTPDEPSLAKRSKGGLVGKRGKPKSPLKLVDEPSDEGVPVEDPAHTDEETDLQRALELKVQGKGKEKVVDEQAAHNLLTLQTPMKKSPVDKFIFQRRPPMHTEPTGQADSPSLDAELPLTDSEMESDEEVPVINAGDQDEGQAGPNPGEQDEGQAGPNPGIQDEGQAGSNPGDAAESQPQPSHGVHARPNREHMDLEATDASSQQKPEQMDEEFTTTAYPNVQENLKLPTEDQVILEEPASSTGTLSSLQNLEKDLSFTDQFFMEKPHEEESGKTNAETEVQSMVSVPIHQDTSSVPPMTTPVIDLTTMQSDSPLPTSTATTSIITTTTSLPPPPQPQQSTADPILVSRIGELEQHMVDLIQKNLALEERLDKQGTQLYNLENLNIPYKVSQAVDEIVTDALIRKRAAPRTPFGSPPSLPPPPPPPAGASGAPASSEAPSSSKPATSVHQSMAWTTSDTKFKSTDFMAAQELSLTDSLIQDDSIPEEQVHLSDDEDSGNDHLPKADSRQDWWKPLLKKKIPATPEPAWTIPSSNVSDIENNWASTLVSTYKTPAENSLLAKTGDMTTFMKWYCRQVNKTTLTQADFEGHAYEVVKAFYPDVIHLQFQMEECHKMFTDQIDWTNPEGDQVRVDVNQPLPLDGPLGHKFYIDRHDSLSHRKDVKTHMRILSVVRIKAYSRYGYDYLSEIVPRRADFQEHMIAEKDFKNLYPSDFEDLNLLLLQGHLDHLPSSDKRMLSTAVKLWTQNLVIRQRVEDFQLGIEIYQTQLNLTKPGWDATGYEFKHDYTIIESPRAVVFSVDNNDRKIMRFNEIYKFSDGTLTRILEALDYRVKEFKVKRLNPGMNTRFWTEKDVTRSTTTETTSTLPPPPHPLQQSTIHQDIEQQVWKICWLHINESNFYTGNPVKEIRLKMNLPDHRSVLTDQEDQAKMEMETPRSSRVNSPPNAHS